MNRVPECKGNTGNIVQHWVLCEVVRRLAQQFPKDAWLHYVDAHAMAPFSRPTERFDFFRDVQKALPGKEGTYERAWSRLAGDNTRIYPSSALFVKEVWTGRISMLLCENDPLAAGEIDVQLGKWRSDGSVPNAELHSKSWRSRFRSSSLGPPEVRPDVVLLSLDPMKIHPREGQVARSEDVGLKDLDLVNDALEMWRGIPAFIQLSSYTSRLGRLEAVSQKVKGHLARNEWEQTAEVIIPGAQVLSMVFARDTDADLSAVAPDFWAWTRRWDEGR